MKTKTYQALIEFESELTLRQINNLTLGQFLELIRIPDSIKLKVIGKSK